MDDQYEPGRLSAIERDLALLVEEGTSLETLNTGGASVSTIGTSLSVTFTHDDGTVETVPLDVLSPLKHLKTPLAEVIALRTEEIERITLKLDLDKLAVFIAFLRGRRRLSIRLEQIGNDLLREFRDWLDEYRTAPIAGTGRSPYAARQRKGAKPLTVDHKRELYRTAASYLARIRVQPPYRDRFQPDLDLNTHFTWKKRGGRDVVPVLTRPELQMLVRLCREEVVETTRRLVAYWAIGDGVATPADLEIVDEALAHEVAAMQTFFGDELPQPCQDQMRVVKRRDDNGTVTAEFSKRTFPLIWAMKGADYQAAVGLLYPSPAKMLPFCLLFAVYYRYNPGVVGALTAGDLKRQPSVFGERLQGTPFKNQAKRRQHASWPVTDDPHNPAEMIKTIARWTAGIRCHAQEGQQDHLFLFRNHVREVKSFAIQNALWRHLSLFLQRHKEAMRNKRFTPKSIRPSVIDLVHHLFDGDVVYASHAGQHRQVDTTIEHYLFDGARKRNDEALAPVTGAMQRWVETGGVIDPRRIGTSATLAATPGWECGDLYAGHIAGEQPGVACRAYGRCVSCELGQTKLESPLAYALNLKLHEAMMRARTTMPEVAWLKRWMPEADLLGRMLALEFKPEAIAAANLDIPDLPTVE